MKRSMWLPAAALLFCSSFASADALDTWTAARVGPSTAPPAPAIGFAFGGGKFVAPGVAGASYPMSTGSVGTGVGFYVSSDGVTWRASRFGANAPKLGVTAMAYANNLFVAGTGDGYIVTSPDGDSWSLAGSGTGQTILSIAYGNGKWVAGAHGLLTTSTDARVFKLANSPGSNGSENVNGLAFGNGQFVAATNLGLYTSPDAVSWTKRLSSQIFFHVAFGNGQWVATGPYGNLYTSSDGVTWTKRTFAYGGNVANLSFVAAAYGGGQWIVGGGMMGTPMVIYTSTDGVTWKQRTSTATAMVQGLAFGQNRFVAITNTANVATVYDSASLLTVSRTTLLPGTTSPTRTSTTTLSPTPPR